jgi:membrane fusion protein (multidrug efflux system)
MHPIQHEKYETSFSMDIGTMRTIIFAGLLFLLFQLSGCEEKTAPQAALPEVRYTELAPMEIILTRNLPGRVRAFTTSEVRPQVSGIIQAKLFDEGADIQAGQILYQIDPALYEAAFNNAKANLAKARANENAARLFAERCTLLLKSNAVRVQDRDNAVAAYNQVKAEISAYEQELETARINLGYTTIVAPVGGRIGRSFVTEGALVTQNQAAFLAKIQTITPVNVDITQSSSQMLRLRRALDSGTLRNGGSGSAKVRLYLDDGTPYMRPGASGQPEWVEGDLMFSDISVDENTGSVTIRAKFDNAGGLLLPGMYVRAELVEGILNQAILVPQKSVTWDARNQPQVLVLTPEEPGDTFKVATRFITIDREYANNWIVTSGLTAGDLLIVDGIQNARLGQTVKGILLMDTEKENNHADNGDTRPLSER